MKPQNVLISSEAPLTHTSAPLSKPRPQSLIRPELNTFPWELHGSREAHRVPEVQRISYSLSGGVIRLLWLSLISLTNTHTLGCIDLSSFGSRLFTIRPCCRRKSDTSSPWEDSMRVLTSSIWIIVALQWQNWTNRPTQPDTISKEDVWVATLCNCGAIS